MLASLLMVSQRLKQSVWEIRYKGLSLEKKKDLSGLRRDTIPLPTIFQHVLPNLIACGSSLKANES
jgi:hypothetical protein